jgi:PadR family transcriptional regulator, regulatory protein PadR
LAKVHGAFEQAVLIAVAVLGPRAPGTAVKDEVSRRLRQKVASGPVHITLQRLEEKGLISSGVEPGSRSGTTRRWFTIEPDGREALREARSIIDSIWDGFH